MKRTLVDSWSSHQAHSELGVVNLRAQADNCTTNLIALIELLASKCHGEPLPALVEQRWIVLHRQHPLPTIIYYPQRGRGTHILQSNGHQIY